MYVPTGLGCKTPLSFLGFLFAVSGLVEVVNSSEVWHYCDKDKGRQQLTAVGRIVEEISINLHSYLRPIASIALYNRIPAVDLNTRSKSRCDGSSVLVSAICEI